MNAKKSCTRFFIIFSISLFALYVESEAVASCPGINVVRPSGNTARSIRDAISLIPSGAPGSVLLSGQYSIESTITLRDDLSICSSDGATLKWTGGAGVPLILDAYSAQRTSIVGLTFDGGNLRMKGDGHKVEGNVFENLSYINPSVWWANDAILVADDATNLQIVGNRFDRIGDTAILAYGLSGAIINGNTFSNSGEGVHIFGAEKTSVSNNVGYGFASRAVEVQGDNLKGLIVSGNAWTQWAGAIDHAMSIVSGDGAIIERNVVIIGSAYSLNGALELGGISPVVRNNNFDVSGSNAGIVVSTTNNVEISGNLIKGGNYSVIKDVNAGSGILSVVGNDFIDPVKAAVTAYNWSGYRSVQISGNNIEKFVDASTGDFYAITSLPPGVAAGASPMIISKNQVVFHGPVSSSTSAISCLFNAGYNGNMVGTLINDNICDGGGFALFVRTNSSGGHTGVVYKNNILKNLKQDIDGDSSGLIAKDNYSFINVVSKLAGFSE